MRLSARWSKHKQSAREGAPWPISAAIRKYGPEAFSIEVVEECHSLDELNAAEIRWIAEITPAYNATAGGGGLASPSEAVRSKISEAGKGRKITENQRAALIARNTGRTVSEATRQKLSEAFKGKQTRKTPMSHKELAQLVARNKSRRIHPEHKPWADELKDLTVPERRAKVAELVKLEYAAGLRKKLFGADNPMYKVPKSESVKASLSLQMAGEKNPFYGKLHTEETRAKMAAAHASRHPVECPHCGVVGRSNAMKRWHFDNCRSVK